MNNAKQITVESERGNKFNCFKLTDPLGYRWVCGSCGRGVIIPVKDYVCRKCGAKVVSMQVDYLKNNNSI